ncbi:MAG: IS1595 family transposase [Terriglobales bacterium]
MNRRQTIPKELRYTINDFNRQFPDDNACIEHLKEQRFPGGIAYCGKCRQEQKHHRVKGRPVYGCDVCLTQISPMAGTIFEHSSTSLRLWYYAMYLMASTRCGISAKQIQRETGVTYKTAWRMFRQIRSLLSESDMQLEGEAVEMDESYFGAKRKRGEKKGRPSRDSAKQCVVGVVERGVGKGRVYATVATDATKATLHSIAKERILPESVVFTDEYASYNGLDGEGYQHRRINHSAGVYVLGDVHTNTIEGFWSLVKRGITGVYHNVGKQYLQTYLDEYSFRYNRRDRGNLIFNDFLQRVCERAASRPVLGYAQTPASQEAAF